MESKDWILILIGAFAGAFVGIPFAIFGNFATDWVKSYFKQRSLSARERRIYILRANYKFIKELKDKPTELVALVGKNIVMQLTWISVLVSFVGGTVALVIHHNEKVPPIVISRIILYVVSFAYLFSTYMTFRILPFFRKIHSFDEYREETIKQLKKLGANLEETEEIKKPVKTRRG